MPTDDANCGACGTPAPRATLLGAARARSPASRARELRRRVRRTSRATTRTAAPAGTRAPRAPCARRDLRPHVPGGHELSGACVDEQTTTRTAAPAATRARRAPCAPAARARSPCQTGLTNCGGVCVEHADRHRQLRRVRDGLPRRATCAGRRRARSRARRGSRTAAAPASTRRPTRQLRRVRRRVPGGQGVLGGACALTCEAGLTDCGGACVEHADRQPELRHVRQRVPGRNVCSGGVCAITARQG